jgi:Gpi18-like mannosyltransferase
MPDPVPTPHQHSGIRWPFVLITLAGAAFAWSVPFATVATDDYRWFLLGWYRHILVAGPITAFAQPFSNYSPAYLYLLSLASLLDGLLPPLLVIKSLSAAGAAWVAFAVARLIESGGGSRPLEGAAWSLLLPTMIINVPFLAQADVFWIAPCTLAVAAAVRRESVTVCIWASIGFAFKAQAASLHRSLR